MQGRISAFDEPRGLGTIDADGVTYPFHCTALLDGTRTIDLDAPVTFEVRAAGMGRWEATRIEKV
jgi:cold shock CspA family protein